MTGPNSIRIDPDTEEMLNHLVSTGRFASIEDAVGEAVSRLLTPEDRLALLHAALDEGDRSGILDHFDPKQFLKRMNELHDDSTNNMAAVGTG